MTTPKQPWFTIADREQCGQAAHAQAMRLYNGQGQERRSMAQDALEVYFGNRRHVVAGAASSEMALLDAFQLATNPQAQNVIQMIVDTMVSHTIRNKVRPFFLTEGGSTEQRDRAKGMMRLTEGVLASEGMYSDLGKLVCKSGYLWDGGFAMAIPDYARNDVTIRQLYPWQILVPEEEGTRPRQAHFVDTVDRQMLLEDFGYDEDPETGERTKNDLYEEIAKAPPAPKEMLPESYDLGGVADRVCVTTSVHLPSGYVDLDDDASFGLDEEGDFDETLDTGHDGVRMVQVDQTVLIREPWPYNRFPWSKFAPMQNPSDYFSRGVPETLAGAQIYVNKTRARIARIVHLNSVARLLLWTKAGINKSKFTNDSVEILETKQPPASSAMYLQGTAPPSELFMEVDRTIEWMKGQYGLNEMSLMGEKPLGVDHAPGMEHLLDEQNLKHAEKFEAWENFIVELGEQIVEACRMLALRDPDFEVMWGDDRELRRIRWKDVELERTKFLCRAQKANLLPQTPAMKTKRLAELMNAAPDPEFKAQAFAMLLEDYPDTQAIVGPKNAERKNIGRRLEKVAKEGVNENTMPHPYLNLEIAKVMAKEAINEAESNGDDRAMQNLIKWWEAADKLQKSLMPPPAPPMAAAMPGAAPPPVPAQQGMVQ